MDTQIYQIFKKVRLLIVDVDGVLTDGRIVYSSNGEELKFFNVQDGLGIHILKRMGIPTVIVTAKASATVRLRARDMEVESIFEDTLPKVEAYEKIKKQYGFVDEQICFIADDLIDLGVMKKVGVPVAVNNACEEIKREAVYITHNNGGFGAVREVVELILKSQNKWKQVLGLFSSSL